MVEQDGDERPRVIGRRRDTGRGGSGQAHGRAEVAVWREASILEDVDEGHRLAYPDGGEQRSGWSRAGLRAGLMNVGNRPVSVTDGDDGLTSVDGQPAPA